MTATSMEITDWFSVLDDAFPTVHARTSAARVLAEIGRISDDDGWAMTAPIVEATGLSPAWVKHILTTLSRRGIVERESIPRETRGRPFARWRARHDVAVAAACARVVDAAVERTIDEITRENDGIARESVKRLMVR